jgi:hypothetical protein
MKRMLLSFFLFPILCSIHMGAEDTKPVIRFIPFAIEGLGPEEARFISTLIQSYVTDIGNVDQREEADMVRGPDFIISGSITVGQDSRILNIKIVKNETGETVHHTSIHKTTTDLTLKAHSLVEAAFSAGFDGTFQEEEKREILTEAKILGTWRGDTGVEIIRLRRGGTGIAILSSGVQMNLVYRIEDNTLKVIQTSPNMERFYHPMPLNIARELSVRAEPWQYELFLYDAGMVLRGIKTSTDVRYEDTRIMEFIPGSVREAEWTKSR